MKTYKRTMPVNANVDRHKASFAEYLAMIATKRAAYEAALNQPQED